MTTEEKKKTPYLDRYTDNLTEKVSKKAEDYQVYGRDKEVEAVQTSLLRRTKNNPILVGEAGVGKTAIVEGFALAILRNQVSPKLKNLTVRSLELSSLMSDEDGGFIVKFKKIIEEMVETKGENLLFIDEIHTIVGAGGSDKGALDAGNIIKPVLSRGEIQLIGATTLDEFHEYIETDRALERRMQPIMVDEPTTIQAIEILEQAKAIYESFHQVSISSEAVKQAVLLSVRYIPDQFLPDKAFDLIDEAATICSTNGLAHVGKQEIAEVLKNKTGIPVTTILKGDKERLDGLKEKLSRRVKGQDEAVEAVVNAITVAQAGLQDQRKPLSSFMFLGTSGVGKTELALALAEGMFDDEEAIIRFDMSEYKQKGDITKLIGDRQTRTKGQLTEKVKQKPYSVILIDEVEKAHSEVVDLFLQVLDAGRESQIYPVYKQSMGLSDSSLPLFPVEGETAVLSQPNRPSHDLKAGGQITVAPPIAQKQSVSLKKIYLFLGGLGVLSVINIICVFFAFAQLSSQSEKVNFLYQEQKNTQLIISTKNEVDVFSRYFLPSYYSGKKENLVDFLSEGDAKFTKPKEGILQSVILEKLNYDSETQRYTVSYILSVKRGDKSSSVRLTFDVKASDSSKYGFVVETEPKESNYLKN